MHANTNLPIVFRCAADDRGVSGCCNAQATSPAVPLPPHDFMCVLMRNAAQKAGY